MEMRIRRNLLWIDGLAGAVAGVAMLLARNWLSDWYRLPRDLLLLIGAANLAYGAYSLSLAKRARRPKALILLLIIANLTWAVICLRWAFVFADAASLLGLVQLVGEALFVGGLASLEWRWREQLQSA
jgi:hypothetical protein